MTVKTFILLQSSPEMHLSTFPIKFDVLWSDEHSSLLWTLEVLHPGHGAVILALGRVQLDPDPVARGELGEPDIGDYPGEIAGSDLDALAYHHPRWEESVIALSILWRVIINIWDRTSAGPEDFVLVSRVTMKEEV